MAFLLIIFSILASSYSWDYKNQGDDWTGMCKFTRNGSPIVITSNSTVDVSSTAENYLSIRFIGRVAQVSAISDSNSYTHVADFGSVEFIRGDSVQSSSFVTSIEFHSPSDHYIDEVQYDLEMQVTIKNPNDRSPFLIIGILFDSSSDVQNDVIQNLIDANSKNVEFNIATVFEGGELKNYYSYLGSMTHPPCGANVVWSIESAIRNISKKQAHFFKTILTGGNDGKTGNARRIQNLGNRMIIKYTNP